MFGRSLPRPLALLCAGAILTTAVLACEEEDGVLFPGLSDDLNAQLTELRGATEPLRDVTQGNAAGYEILVTHPESGERCLNHAQLGAMGFHYLNPDLVDDAVSVAAPEVLIYEPQSDGSLALVGVEYVVPFAIRGDDEAPPILFGREFKRNYTFDLWALHAWVWRENPSGVFADYNPAVSCANADAVD